MRTIDSLAIFPLGTVLFPGGVLPLRIFEARYVDMVRECMASSQPFGVCLITRGREVGRPAEHEALGCTASIADWDMEQPGILQLRTVGGERFQILERRTQRDGLIRARVELIDSDPATNIPDEFAMCVTLIERIIEDVDREEPEDHRRILAQPYSPQDAGWVANRLAELLPLDMPSRQHLMSLSDPLQRLALIHESLREQQIIQAKAPGARS